MTSAEGGVIVEGKEVIGAEERVTAEGGVIMEVIGAVERVTVHSTFLLTASRHLSLLSFSPQRERLHAPDLPVHL